MFLRSSLILALSFAKVYACGCREPTVPFKRDHSEVIFRGTIIALRDAEKAASIPAGWGRDTKKIVVFSVSRVWKGEVGQTFEMPAVEETSMCLGFWQPILTVGSDLLVYASHSGGSEYYTSICGFHKPALGAKDFKKLGPGKYPQIP
jgi:hypothetical protein